MYLAGLAGEHGHPAGVELGGVGLVFAAREHVNLVRHDDIDEAGQRQDLAPLCIQQSAGNSATPEVDVVFRVLGHLLMHEDIADLDAATFDRSSNAAPSSVLRRISAVMSTESTRPVEPACRAAVSESNPAPQPTSTMTSPGSRSPKRNGLPVPAKESTVPAPRR